MIYFLFDTVYFSRIIGLLVDENGGIGGIGGIGGMNKVEREKERAKGEGLDKTKGKGLKIKGGKVRKA